MSDEKSGLSTETESTVEITPPKDGGQDSQPSQDSSSSDE